MVRCLKAFFGSYVRSPLARFTGYISLAQQRAGLDDVVGKKTGRGYSSLTDGGETFIDGSFAAAKVPN